MNFVVIVWGVQIVLILISLLKWNKIWLKFKE